MKTLKDALKWLGEVRDGFLVAAGLLYFLGYIGWAFFSWSRQIGVAPPFQAQYFLSSLPLLFVIAVASGIAFVLYKALIKRLPVWFSEQNRPVKLGFIFVLFVLMFVAALLQYVFKDYNFGLSQRPIWLTLALGAVFIIGLLVLAASGFPGEEIAGFTTLLYLAIISIAFVPYLYLVVFLYPKIPQYFGGGKPRCAQVDLYSERFSQETLSELALDPSNPLPIMRSREVGLIFSADDAVFVFAPQVGEYSKRFELKRSDISAIEWCPAFGEKPASP